VTSTGTVDSFSSNRNIQALPVKYLGKKTRVGGVVVGVGVDVGAGVVGGVGEGVGVGARVGVGGVGVGGV